MVAVALLGTVARAFRAADVTGSYEGNLVVDGQAPLATLLELKQQGNDVTGKVGDPKKPEEMIPVTGTVEGDDVSLTGKPPVDNMTVIFKLKLANGHLKGTATFDMGAQKIDFTADLTKK